MLKTLKLLLPIFIPSWRFFKEIAPSPRIEFTLRATTEEASSQWQDFSLRPDRRSATSILTSIFYNPRWNESLFIMNCAEQLIINPNDFNEQEIMRRIKTELERKQLDLKVTPYLQFRLVFISRQGSELQKDILFVSESKRISEL